MTRAQFFAILAALVVAFIFGFGGIWRRPWDPDASILWTYAPIPVLVAACLAWNRTWRASRWIRSTLTLAITKYLITAAVYIAVLAFAGEPPKAPAPAASAPSPSSRPPEPEPTPTPLDPRELGAVEGALLGADGSPESGAVVGVTAGLDRFVLAPAGEPVELTVGPGGFEPRLAAAHARQRVRITSRDGSLHTVNARNDSGRFLKNEPVIPTLETRFQRARGRVALRCSVHPDEGGTVVVLGNPCFATTGADGTFALQGVPAGRATITAWSADGGEISAEIDVAPGATTRVAWKR